MCCLRSVFFKFYFIVEWIGITPLLRVNFYLLFNFSVSRKGIRVQTISPLFFLQDIEISTGIFINDRTKKKKKKRETKRKEVLR